MAANMTNWLESQVVNAMAGEATLPAIGATIKLRLHTGDPTDAGSANALATGGGYDVSGQAVTFADLATLLCTSNAFTITNCPAGTITHFTVWDGTTNVWFWGTYSKTLSVGKDLEFTGGEFDIVYQGDMTEVLAQKITNAFRNVGSYTNVTPTLRAFTASPGTTGLISNEAADGGYTPPTPTWAAESGGAIDLASDASYGTWVGAESITHLGVADDNETTDKLLWFDAPTGGTVVMAAGEVLRSKAGEFTVTAT